MARDSAAAPPVRLRWGLASRRLCLGADPLVFRSPVTSSGADGVGLVPVRSGDPREPHRQPVRWGSPGRLTRFGNRVCAAGHVGEDDLDRRLQQSGSPQMNKFIFLSEAQATLACEQRAGYRECLAGFIEQLER